MAKVHSKNTVVLIEGTDISVYCNASTLSQANDTHDTTGYGSDSHEFVAGLANGTFTCGGVYDSTTDAPPDVLSTIQQSADKVAAIDYAPEGNTATKPAYSFNAVLTSYELSAPFADMVTWSAEFQISGDVTFATAPVS